MSIDPRGSCGRTKARRNSGCRLKAVLVSSFAELYDAVTPLSQPACFAATWMPRRLSCPTLDARNAIERRKFSWPRTLAARISRQEAVFTVHGPPSEPVSESHGELYRVDIDSSFRPVLLKDLARFGVSHASMFPGLEGLSRAINWQYGLDRVHTSEPHVEAVNALGNPRFGG